MNLEKNANPLKNLPTDKPQQFTDNNSAPGADADNLQPERKVKVTTQFANSIYKKIVQYKRAKGLSHDQDVIRIAVAYWTEKNGL
jgi:hypothetical protein